MELIAIDFETGKAITLPDQDHDLTFLSAFENTNVTERKFRDMLDRFELSPDLKELLLRIGHMTLKVGERIYQLGKHLIGVVSSIVAENPKTTFGLILGLLVSTLAGSIPVLGMIFGPLLGPLAIILGVTIGYFRDFADQTLMPLVEKSANNIRSPR